MLSSGCIAENYLQNSWNFDLVWESEDGPNVFDMLEQWVQQLICNEKSKKNKSINQ